MAQSIILRDGRVAELKKAELQTEDIRYMKELFGEVSERSLYLRFFHVYKDIREQTLREMIGDGGPTAMTLLSVTNGRAVAVGSYVRISDFAAEVSFLVADDLQQKGIGSLLLEHLAQVARNHGIVRFEANLLAENHQMLKVFRASGYDIKSQHDSGVIHLECPLRETERTRGLQDARDRMATAASLHGFFHPETVAVVGASRDSSRLGHVLLRNILDADFQGTVYPVNPSAKAVAGVRAYKTIADIQDTVDLVVVAVPREQVEDVIDECISLSIRSILVTTSGFSDFDEQGLQLEERIVQKLRRAGCRLIGPTSFGCLETSGNVQLNASFAPVLPEPGNVAIASHSGALGIAILDYATRAGIGVSSFVSLGNRADVGGHDLLQYWETDGATELIFLHLEVFGNPRKFSRIARRIAEEKPIIAVKSARTPTSLGVSKGHHMRTAANDVIVESMFRQAGIIRVDTLQEMFDVAALLQTKRFKGGKRVAIVTNTAGGAVISVDTLLREGLEFHGPVHNVGFEALADAYRSVLPKILRDRDVDAVLIVFTPVGQADEEAIRIAISTAICEVAEDAGDFAADGGIHPYEKPIVANFLTTGDYAIRYIPVDNERSVPIYPFPEQGVRALAKVVEYLRFRERDKGHIPDFPGVDFTNVRTSIRRALQDSREETMLPQDLVDSIIRDSGLSELPEIRLEAVSLREVELQVDPDSLFGPLMRLQRGKEGRNWESAWVPSVVHLTPLTDMDADDFVHSFISLAGDADARVAEVLTEAVLRLSQLVEEIPEILKIKLGFRLVDDLWALHEATCTAVMRLNDHFSL